MQNKNSPQGLVGLERRFVKFGGGVSDVQLDWLRQELQACPRVWQHWRLHKQQCLRCSVAMLLVCRP